MPVVIPSGYEESGYGQEISGRDSSYWSDMERQVRGRRKVDGGNPEVNVRPSDQNYLKNLPGYEKLSPVERGIYNILPRITEGFSWIDGKLQSNWLGRQAKWAGSWAGKALSVLDIGAEFLERSAGLVVQGAIASKEGQFEDFTKNLADAWYAGSMLADMTSLPRLKYDREFDTDGNIIREDLIGIEIPNELPGGYGVHWARKTITDLTQNQGYSRKEATELVKANFYDNLGGLALRSQLYDTYFHLLADPLNVIMPKLAPVERLHVARINALGKIAPETFQEIQDAYRLAQNAENIADIEKYYTALQTMRENGRLLTRADKFVIALTGGDPLQPQNKLLQRLNPFALTRESRAMELLNVGDNNLKNYIFSTTDDPHKMSETIRRALEGGLGPEFGSAFMTVEGRVAQAAMAGADVEATKLVGMYDEIADERAVLDRISELTGMKPAQIVEGAAAGESQLIFNKLQKAIGESEDAARLTSEFANLSVKHIDDLKLLRGTPYTRELFKLYLSNAISNKIAEFGIVRFGVESRGLLTRISTTMKAAETLAFLRLNPGFAIRNFINNEVTMIARGVGGVVNKADLEKFVTEILKFEPHRLSQAAGIMGDVITTGASKEYLNAGTKLIAEALRGERGFLSKATDFFNSIELPKGVDMGEVSRLMETSASQRAFYAGYMQGWNRYFWKPGAGYDRLRDVVNTAGIADGLPDDIVRAIENAVGDARNIDDIDRVVRGNLNLSSSNVIQEFETSAGKKLDDVFSPEMVEKIRNGLDTALKDGPEGVRTFFKNIKKQQLDDLQDMFDARLGARLQHFTERVKAEGPAAFTHAWADIADEWWGAHNAYARHMDYLTQGINSLPRELATARWDAIQEIQQSYWGRSWKRFETALQGLESGATQAGINVPRQIMPNFRSWRRETERFFKARNTLIKGYMKKEVRAPGEWDDIQRQIDGLYNTLIRQEDQLLKQVDDGLANMLTDDQDRLVYNAWRQKARDLSRADKEAVVGFRQTLSGMTPDQKESAWRTFWNDRVERWQELRRTERAAAYAIDNKTTGPVQREISALQDAELLSARNSRGIVDPARLPARETPPAIEDNVRVAFDIDQNAYEFEYRLVEMDDLIVSHDVNFKPNPDYPSALQPRDRDRAALQAQVDDIIQKFNPSSLLYDSIRLDDGPMIVGPDMVVESGNGRILAMRKMPGEVYSRYTFSLQQAWPGRVKGVGDPDTYWTQFNNPVLVRVRRSNVDRVKFASIANGPNVAEMSAFEKAIGDAALIPDNVLVNLKIGDNDDFAAILDNPANSDFIASFRDMVPKNQHNAFFTADGTMLSQEGKDRVLSAMIARAFPGESGRRIVQAFVELPDDVAGNIKNIKSAIVGAVGDLNKLESAIASGKVLQEFSIADDLSAALDMYRRVRKMGMTVPDFLRQAQMFDDLLTPMQRNLLFFIDGNKRAPRAMREFLRRYVKSALEQSTQPSLMDIGAVTREDLIRVLVGDGQSANTGKITWITDKDIAELGAAAVDETAARAALRPFIQDMRSTQFDSVTPPIDLGEDQLMYNSGWETLGRLEEQSLDSVNRPPLAWDNLSAPQTALVEKYIKKVKGQFLDARMASIKYGEFKRDAALLNYNRRFNYNSWLGLFAPFEFWATQSVMKWALHSIDRPAMLSSYLRIKELMDTAGLPDENFPTRLKGSFRVSLPFLPDWMGKAVWIDPIRTALPFDNFSQPWENEIFRQTTLEGRAERLLQKWIGDDEVDDREGTFALENKSGDLWERAIAEAQANDARMKFDPMDFVSMFTAPHAPIQWAYEVARGTPEDIGPFTPASRMLRSVAGLLGVDWNNSPLNLEAQLRKKLGLPAFDKWDDYRTDRMLSNMVSNGEISVQDSLTAMIERGDNPVFQEARRKADLEFSVGGIGSMLGIPAKAYPVGEESSRMLQDDFGRAYDAYKAGDVEALRNFFDNNPEYEARLAIWDEPQERMRNFLIDGMWSKYHDMPSPHKAELKEQLGPEFQQYFLDKETRSYESIPIETMQIWLKMMGGDPPGTLNSPAPPLVLTDSDIAWRVDNFYDIRTQLFPDYRDLQNTYFDLEEGTPRRKYLKEHPELIEYWDWRRDFMQRNPDTAAYLEDDPDKRPKYKTEAERNAAYANQPSYYPEELRGILGSNLYRLALNYANTGAATQATKDELQKIASRQGITVNQLLSSLRMLLNSQ